MPISSKILDFMDRGSWIRKMFEEGIALKKQFGEENVFDLSLGNPVMEPPQEFFDELKSIASEPIKGMHRYMPNAGLEITRQAIASELNKETGFNFSSNHIVMTCGAGGALNVVMKTLLNQGDEVVIFSPFFVEYQFYADNHGGSCKIVNPDENFLPDFESLFEAINKKTKAVLINSPNNPTGVMYSKEILEKIAQIISEKEKQFDSEIFFISDEPYRKIVFDGLEYPHIFQFHPRTIVATSHSKDLALPGERIGYIAVNPDYTNKDILIDGLVFCNRTLGFVNAPALIQYLIVNLQSVTIDVLEYQNKRDFMYKELSSIGYETVLPQGAFYMFPKSPIKNDVEFIEILKEQNVLAVPGKGFGCSGHFRISYCLEDSTLEGSIPGLKAAFNNI
ncbi:MAG: pyridoxal phosphate-dependent aminotransferase [SAR202 cluster bacterium]|nr:pyridoxal phosphate-dependent aminotransferase [SAR202 cluster bacterium]